MNQNNRKRLVPGAIAAIILSLLAIAAARVGAQGEAKSMVKAAAPHFYFGVLQSDAANAPRMRAAGLQLAEVGLAWDRYQPSQSTFNPDYAREMAAKIAKFRAAGTQIVLDLGMQYPPRWIFDVPNSRYVNQFGQAFVGDQPGFNGANTIFNRAVREKQALYLKHVFADLGADFFAVRLGWGYYSELNFPTHKYGGHENCYWAFDAIAQGKIAGLPDGIAACPVASWIPGTPSRRHRLAARFADWYIGALQNYHDWQIRATRKYFGGRLMMLYPSWGIRPGQLEGAVAGDLSGETSPEKNGEIGRGFDFARFIAGITDAKVAVYSTWIDAPFGDDKSRDASQWTPAHYLSFVAGRNLLPLEVWGENTGNADFDALQRSVQRMRDFDLSGLMWAFEPQLLDEKHATLAQFAAQIDLVQSAKPTDTAPNFKP